MQITKGHVPLAKCLTKYICPSPIVGHPSALGVQLEQKADVAPPGEVEAQMVREEVEGVPLWRCLACPYNTKHKAVLYQHVESKHTFSQGYSCPYCCKFCPSRNALRCHVSRQHNSVKKNLLLQQSQN